MWPDLALFQHTSDALAVIDGDRFVDVNPGALRMFGCGAPDHMLGYRLADFSPLQQVRGVLSAPTLAALAWRARQLGNQRFDWRCVGRTGRQFWIDVLLTRVPHEGRHLLCAAMREITARHDEQVAIYLALMATIAARSAMPG
ncbi:hypothetical protein ASF61_11655 [Duganella sp. Leaf126]|uniref:PAS domain-containing protein n=1 Tax=Duganella sp. Leaf126 TaxID=1736266 RepID=UPI0006FA99C6|nr:PAS domain-containing protein [Duganella sp. Leaf126]KQQ33700.1 hypothetical protein ASF61_11655 [Duganella sp. Leaf126]